MGRSVTITSVRLSLRGRAGDLLIWFTKLPRDPSGTHQASVYGISIQGRP